MIMGTYDMVDKVWKIRNLYQGKMVVDLVHSTDSNLSKDKANFF